MKFWSPSTLVPLGNSISIWCPSVAIIAPVTNHASWCIIQPISYSRLWYMMNRLKFSTERPTPKFTEQTWALYYCVFRAPMPGIKPTRKWWGCYGMDGIPRQKPKAGTIEWSLSANKTSISESHFHTVWVCCYHSTCIMKKCSSAFNSGHSTYQNL